MDLQNVELVLFRKRLAELEESAEDPVARKRSQRYAGLAFLACLLSCFAVMLPLLLMLGGMLGLGFFALLALAAPGSLIPLSFPIWRYEIGAERRWMRRIAGPQARAFLEKHWDRRAELREASCGFDASLNGLKLLPSGIDPEADAGLAESMALRRDALEADAAEYLRAFEAATVEDRARFAAGNAVKDEKKKADPRKIALREFKKKVLRLEDLEEALDRLPSAADAGVTVDLSPFVAAQRYRRELEGEREALIARGLKPRKLTKPRNAPRKLLPAAV